jgi:DNA-binding protein H-NS
VANPQPVANRQPVANQQLVANQQPMVYQQPVAYQQQVLYQQPVPYQQAVLNQQPANGVTTASYPPQATPLLPPAVNVTPNPTLAPANRAAAGPTVTFGDVGPASDVHQVPGPTVGGAILGMMPGEHPVERAAIATQQLHQELLEKKTLETREQQLKAELALREKSIREATNEVKEATEEIRRTKTALQATLLEADEKQAALRKREQADAETIKEILKKLDHPPEGTPTSGQTRTPGQTPTPMPMPMPGPDDHAPTRQ